jgi:FAD:protein FMN transferase
MRREEFRAMGTTISMLLPERQAEMGVQIVRTLFSEWEQTMSRFLPESELSQLNQQAGTSVAVSDLFYEVLATALTAAQATEGVYDPALLDQLIQVGYDRTFDDLPTVRFDPIIPGEPGGRWRGIKVDPIRRYVTLPSGIKLDFGGIAKGMAVDAALEHLHQNGINSALVNAGGDLAVLRLPPIADQWPVAVPGREQFWSVTVVADHCEQAEVAAKVAFILGSGPGADFLRNHRIAGLLVHVDGMWETVEPWPTNLMEEISI